MYYGGQNSREFSKSVWNPTLKGRCEGRCPIWVTWGRFLEPVGLHGAAFWSYLGEGQFRLGEGQFRLGEGQIRWDYM